MRLATLILGLGLAINVPLRAAPWVLADCGAEGQTAWQVFEQSVRTAKPGSHLYVPKAYPQTDPAAIMDFLYQYRSLHRDQLETAHLPVNESLLAQGIANSTVTYQVLRVENWSPLRCGREQRRNYFILIRVFDVASGAEIARAALAPSGLYASYVTFRDAEMAEPAAAQRDRIMDPAQAMQVADAQFNVKGQSPEYVATWGTIYCPMTSPCLAFKQANDAYIVYKSALYKVNSGPLLAVGKDLGTPEINKALLESLAANERLVSLGGPIYTTAREVAHTPAH
jgi:hypothetical protein